MHSATSFQAAVLNRHVLTTLPQVPALSSGVVDDHRLIAPAQLPMSGHDRYAHTHHCGPRPKITAEAKVPRTSDAEHTHGKIAGWTPRTVGGMCAYLCGCGPGPVPAGG
jgi:hypothetical protein